MSKSKQEFVKHLIFRGLYLATLTGEVLSFHSSSTGKTLKQMDSSNGYKQVVLCYYRKFKTVKVHQLVWLTFNSEVPEGFEINHINGIKTDNRLANLELTTHSKNILHAIDTGFQIVRRGSEAGNAKLVESQVLEIRQRHAQEKISAGTLAKQYNVSKSQVLRIINKESWVHI